MRAYTVDQIRVIDPVKGTADLELSSARNPFYGFRFELRAPKLDSTIVIEVTIEKLTDMFSFRFELEFVVLLVLPYIFTFAY